MLLSKRNAERQEKRLSKLASNQERAVMRQMEKQSKWSRREEQSFYKAISTYGVDCSSVDQDAVPVYNWERFKEISQLDKKLDETLTDYYQSFYYMCKKVCQKLGDDEKPPTIEVQVETISEERASRCLQRIDLLNKVRNDVHKNVNFNEWILNRCAPSSDLPDWYVPGKHDRDLVRAASRYGITRTEFYYVQDPEFSFKKYLYKYLKHIESLMALEVAALPAPEELENDPVAAAAAAVIRNQDPIQYYFQNQAKIQVTFREMLTREDETKKKVKIKKKVKKMVKIKRKKVKEPVTEKTVEKEADEKKNIDEEMIVDEENSKPVKSPAKSSGNLIFL